MGPWDVETHWHGTHIQLVLCTLEQPLGRGVGAASVGAAGSDFIQLCTDRCEWTLCEVRMVMGHIDLEERIGFGVAVRCIRRKRKRKWEFRLELLEADGGKHLKHWIHHTRTSCHGGYVEIELARLVLDSTNASVLSLSGKGARLPTPNRQSHSFSRAREPRYSNRLGLG